MTRLLPLAALLVLAPAAPANAADRSYGIGSFERLRVDGPFDVRVVTGASPRATVSGDADQIERIEVRVDGTTLVVRMGGDGWNERPRTATTTVPVVTLTTPRLSAATVFSGGRITIAGMRGDRVDLTVSGAGTLAVTGADTPRLNATIIGTGAITLAGRAAQARLLTNGPGTIDAAALVTDAVAIRLDGPGETRAQARYTAEVTNTGLGRVSIAGKAKCTIKALAGGPVSCGPTP